MAAQTAGPRPLPVVGISAPPAPDSARLRATLGGRDNIVTVEALAGRLRVTLRDAARVEHQALGVLAVRGVAMAAPGVVACSSDLEPGSPLSLLNICLSKARARAWLYGR